MLPIETYLLNVHPKGGALSALQLPSASSSLPVVGAERLAVLLEHLVMVGEGDLELVRALLVVPPGGLTVALLLGHPLVLHLNLLLVGGLALGVVVLEHATHAKNVRALVSVSLLLLFVSISCGGLLALLLLGPLEDLHLILLHSVVVHYKEKE